MVKQLNVKKETNAKVVEIAKDHVSFERDGQLITIACDTVLNAVGFRANNQLEDALEAICDDVTVVGDAIAPRKILTAVHEGYHAIRTME